MPPPPPPTLTGTVLTASLMTKAVKVLTREQTYHPFLRKRFVRPKTHLVSDPTSALRAGDVVRIAALAEGGSKRVRHVVTEILAPYGTGLEERPRLLSAEEREEEGRRRREKEEERRWVRWGKERWGERAGEGGGEGDVGGLGGRRREREEEKERRWARWGKERWGERAGKGGVVGDVGREEKALGREEEAEMVQKGLDEKRVGVEDVEKRLQSIGV